MALSVGAYLSAVESRYLAVMAQGHALSAVDVDRVLKWHREEVPLRIVLGLIDDLERQRRREGGEGRMGRFSLGRIQRSLDAALKRRGERLGLRHVSEAAAEAKPSEGERLLKAMERAGVRLVETKADATLVGLWRQGFRELKETLVLGQDLWEWSGRFDERVAEALPTCVEVSFLQTLDAALYTQEQKALERMSLGARVERLSFLRARALRAHFHLPELMALLLDDANEVP